MSTHELPQITPQLVSQVTGCSLRAAYYYLQGERQFHPKVARKLADHLKVSPLVFLYPGDYDAQGNLCAAPAKRAAV